MMATLARKQSTEKAKSQGKPWRWVRREAASSRPPVTTTHFDTQDLAYELVRVLDREGRAVGPWAPQISTAQLRKGLRSMMKTRIFDSRMLIVQRQRKISFYMQALGEEAIACAHAAAIEPGDMCFPTYRQQGLLLSRSDALIVATVSAIYGLGDPDDYLKMRMHLMRGEHTDQRKLIRHLTELQYTRGDYELRRGTYRVRGEVIDVFPAESEAEALRIELFDGDIENLAIFDPLTGEVMRKVPRFTVYPKTHYATTRDSVLNAVDTIKAELKERLDQLYKANKLVEAQRLQQRTQFDVEMMAEIGYCNGIENYSRHLTRRAPGEPPPTLFDYLPPDALLVVDESHVTIPQLGAMYKGDRSRKETLVEFGFRLPSALDNRPLKFE